MRFNLNSVVKVKVTPAGHAHLKRRHDEILRPTLDKEYIPTDGIDEEGYHSYELWDLMASFGEATGMGWPEPIEMDIVIHERDIKND